MEEAGSSDPVASAVPVTDPGTAGSVSPSRALGLLSVAIVAVCMVLVHPVVESGMVDDWSIVRTAQRLAETGHIHYNGWEAPMLGWPLYLAAAVFRVFGFSFTGARLVTMGIALATVYLAHRIFVRFGISGRNATLGAVTLGLSPVFFQCSVLFMTDVPATFAVLVCLYCCLRAVQSTRYAGGWVAAGALLNAILGTTRQNAWLGLLVIVPCTTFLLRRDRRAVAMGCAAWIAGVSFMLSMLWWLSRQPYVLPEHLIYNVPHPPMDRVLVTTTFRVAMDLLLLLLPVAFAFVPKIRPNKAVGTGALVVFAFGFMVFFSKHPTNRLSPFLLFSLPQTAENTFLSYSMPIFGNSPSHFPEWLRVVSTLSTFLSALGIAAALGKPGGGLIRGVYGTRYCGDGGSRPPLLLVVPFALACFGLLLPRAIYIFTLDRYLILLLPFALLLLLLLYERVGDRKPSALAVAVAVLFGGYTVLTTHDLFAVYRANLAAVTEVRDAGVPANQISGGMEYDAYTQLLLSDFVHTPTIRMPDGSIFRGEKWIPANHCAQIGQELLPDIHPRYGVAYPDSKCVAAPQFAVVHFSTWLPPFHRAVEVIDYRLEKP